MRVKILLREGLAGSEGPRRERGAAAVLVAVVLPVLFGMVMLTVDAGAVWASRRALVTATDAAALAGARRAAVGENGCAAASDSVSMNVADASVEQCRFLPGTHTLRVQAVGSPVPARFGRVLGMGDQIVRSASSATWGAPSAAWGLRPIGVCVNDPQLSWWTGTGPDPGTNPDGSRRVHFMKSSPDQCGGSAPGNWGWIDLDGGSNSNADMVEWLLHGYGAPVGVDDCNGDGVPGDRCEGDTGSRGSSVNAALTDLQTSGEEFPIFIYDHVTGEGSEVLYRVYGYVAVVLKGYRVIGAEAGRYFDFEFKRLVVRGTCCRVVSADAGVYAVRLCAADEEIAAGCAA